MHIDCCYKQMISCALTGSNVHQQGRSQGAMSVAGLADSWLDTVGEETQRTWCPRRYPTLALRLTIQGNSGEMVSQFRSRACMVLKEALVKGQIPKPCERKKYPPCRSLKCLGQWLRLCFSSGFSVIQYRPNWYRLVSSLVCALVGPRELDNDSAMWYWVFFSKNKTKTFPLLSCLSVWVLFYSFHQRNLFCREMIFLPYFWQFSFVNLN